MREQQVGEGARDHVDRGAPADRRPDPVEHRARAGSPVSCKTLAREVAADGVTVNSLLPGTARDRAAHGAARRGALDDLAASVPAGVLGARPTTSAQIAAFLCSEHARFVTGAAITGRRWRLRRTALMFRHVVLLPLHRRRRRRRTCARVADALNALPARIPADPRLPRRHRRRARARETPHFAVVADFDDVAGYVVYRDDPEHQRVIAELIRPFLASAPPRSTRSSNPHPVRCVWTLRVAAPARMVHTVLCDCSRAANRSRQPGRSGGDSRQEEPPCVARTVNTPSSSAEAWAASRPRVLADHFDRVTILDRDELPIDGIPRRGVPQGRHAHALLAGGLREIAELFPGIVDELLPAAPRRSTSTKGDGSRPAATVAHRSSATGR